MISNLNINSKATVSLDELLLHVVIDDGSKPVFQRVMLANDNEQVTQLFNDAAASNQTAP